MWSRIPLKRLKKDSASIPTILNNNHHWRRPSITKEWDPTKNSLIFQQIDLDHYYLKNGSIPVIRYYKFTHIGLSVHLSMRMSLFFPC